MAEDTAKTVVQARISSHLDYYNSLLLHIANNLLQRLQSIQNVIVAAQLITRTGRHKHITPVLCLVTCSAAD